MSNVNIDYSNIRDITKKLKSQLKDKYKSLEKITSEAAVNSISDGGGGAGGDPLGEMGDLLDIFFNQGTYNGTLKVNGGLVVDYVESAEGPASGQTDINTVRSMINTAITANNRRQAFGGGLAGASSIGALNGTIIKGANISGSSITGGIMRGTRVEDLQGLNELFRRDYLDLYSINTARSDFDFFVRSGYNNIKFSYDTKENDYLKLSFGEQLDVYGDVWTQAFSNNYFHSQFFNVLFRPKNNYITDKSVFKIQNMDFKVGDSLQQVKTTFTGEIDVNNLSNSTPFRVNGKSVTSSEGFGFVAGQIDINDGIQTITVKTPLTNAEKIPLFANKGDSLTISTALNNTMITEFYSNNNNHIASAEVNEIETLSDYEFTTTLIVSNPNNITLNDTVRFNKLTLDNDIFKSINNLSDINSITHSELGTFTTDTSTNTITYSNTSAIKFPITILSTIKIEQDINNSGSFSPIDGITFTGTSQDFTVITTINVTNAGKGYRNPVTPLEIKINNLDITSLLDITNEPGSIESIGVGQSGQNYDTQVNAVISGGDPTIATELVADVDLITRGIESVTPVAPGGQGYDSNNLPIIAVTDATVTSGLTLTTLFKENISLENTDNHYDSQISSIITTIGNSFRDQDSSRYTKTNYDSIGTNHIMGFEGIVNLVLLSDIECTIRRRSTGFLESITFGEDLVTINSNINLNIDTILNNRIITQENSSSEQQGKGTIRFTVIDYGDSVQENEIDIDITIKFFINRTDAQYKTFVESGQSTNNLNFYSDGDNLIQSNNYPFSINVSNISNKETITYNSVNLSYKVHNNSRSDGIFSFDGVTQFNSFQNVVLGGETKLGIGYTRDQSKQLGTESFHVAQNGIKVHGDSTYTDDLNIGGDTTISGNLTVNGNTTTVDTTNLTVKDNLIVLSKDNTNNAASTTSGLIIETINNDNNRAIVWDKTKFKFVETSSTGDDATFTTGNGSDIEIKDVYLNAINSSSTNTNANITITPKGTGSVVLSKVEINGGAIDGTAIGSTTTSSGAFTSVTTSGTLTTGGLITADAGLTVTNGQTLESNLVDINGGAIDGTAIGSNVTSTGAFTSVTTSSTLTASGLITANAGLTITNGQTLESNSVDINGGAIDGTAIGSNATSTGAFTTLSTSGTLEVEGTITARNGMTILNGDLDVRNRIINDYLISTDTNQVISGIKTFNEEIVGDLLGDVTGDITGNLSGNVTGNLTGNVTGNLTGDVTGNLSGSSGSCTGNSATATKIDSIENNDIMLKDANETITGIKTFNEEIVGDLIGDVAGNVTGNITGDVTGNLTGDVTGDVTGNLTGNIDLNSGIIKHTDSTLISTAPENVVYTSGTNQANKHKLTFDNVAIPDTQKLTITVTNIAGVTVDSVIYASSEQAVIITPHSVVNEGFQLKIENISDNTLNALSINFVIF